MTIARTPKTMKNFKMLQQTKTTTMATAKKKKGKEKNLLKHMHEHKMALV